MKMRVTYKGCPINEGLSQGHVEVLMLGQGRQLEQVE